MKKIFLVLCLGMIGFSRISSAARKTGEEITKVKQNAEKIESETSVDKAEEVKEIKEEKKKNKSQNPFKKKKVEWELVWRDEFDENKMDTSKWSYWENGNPWNSGNYLDENGDLVDQYGFKAKQYYLRDNVKFEDGYLVITVKKEDNKTVKIDGKDRKILYSSGAIHTKDKFSVREGKIEMRATMPEGIGTWPAFWTWPEGYSQASNIPAKEEIDVFEIYGDNLQRVTGTAHALKADNTYASFVGSDLKIKKNEDLTRFNTYAVEWDEKEIKWLFNGRVYKRLSMKKVGRSSENIFKLPHFLIINVALQNKTGEDGDVKFPTEMKVDYVRVYKKK
jgi:endo-beta-1,3-glucanase